MSCRSFLRNLVNELCGLFSVTWNFYYPCCRPKLYGGPMKSIYEFDSMHCHWGKKDDRGSEHLLNGKRFSMECHLIWYDCRYGSKEEARNHNNGLVVMALLYKVTFLPFNNFVLNLNLNLFVLGQQFRSNNWNTSSCETPSTLGQYNEVVLSKYLFRS